MSPASSIAVVSLFRDALGPSVDRVRACGRDGGTDDPEAVHLARVATRRLRADLKALRGPLGEGWDGDIRPELAWIGALLGAVRDADVLAAELDAELELAPDAMQPGGAYLGRVVHLERDRAHDALRASIDGERFAALLAQLTTLLADPPAAPVTVLEPSVVMAPAWRTLKREVRQLGPEASDRQLHDVRIATKRARYAAEMFAATSGKGARRFVRRAGRVQDALGRHHDAVVALAWLLDRTPPDGDAGLSIGWLAARFANAREAERHAWRARWEALARPEARFW